MNRLPVLALSLLGLLSCTAQAQSVSLSNSVVTESFDSLLASGTGTALPEGWYIAESGSGGNANGQYKADNGGLNSGDTYSYGATGSSERALGGLQSSSVNPLIGVRIRNDSGSELTEIGIAYTGEQWRLGAIGRVDKLTVEVSADATAVNDAVATWTPVPALEFVAPVSAGTVGPLDGNAAAQQVARAATVSGLAVAAGQDLWVRWVDANATSSDDGLAIDDVVLTPPGGGVDNPPAVTGSTPAQGALDVDPSANLQVQFSEPVSLGANAIGLDCGGNPQGFATSGGPRTWTFDPDADLPASSTCALTVTAAEVGDQDGGIDFMQVDYTASFTTAAPPPDLAPSVASTVPAANAGNVATTATVTINFSEPVDVVDPWFGFSCTASGTVAALASGGPTAFVLTPSTALQEAETCTVTVFATQVGDRDGSVDPMAADHVFSFGTTAGVGDYYASVDASTAGALRTTLHALIDDHTVYPYSAATTDTWDILELADEDPADPNRVLDIYRNCSFAKVSDRDGGSGGGATCGASSGLRFNREHTWPNSLGFGSATGNLGLPYAPYTDTHMLFLSEKVYNADRGNKPYANCDSGCGSRPTVAHPSTGGGTGGDGDSNWVASPDGNAGSFEVWDVLKGDVARAMFYMDVRYEGGVDGNSGQSEPDLVLTDNRSLITITSSSPAYMGLLSDLLAWHQADPPDARERARNDVVYSFQGNRNPFVDHPEWVACLFQSVCDAAARPPRVFADSFESLP